MLCFGAQKELLLLAKHNLASDALRNLAHAVYALLYVCDTRQHEQTAVRDLKDTRVDRHCVHHTAQEATDLLALVPPCDSLAVLLAQVRHIQHSTFTCTLCDILLVIAV
jgi:hypothetical protein